MPSDALRGFRPFRAVGHRLRRRSEPVHIEVVDASWHLDTDAICPDCLRWISPDDYVRRNAFDMPEHEVCPPVSIRQRT